ncbi:MAG TPA: pirin family protein [bacterium]|nr:pirin family protein [bacterium]HND77225.1 pirin family protein [bacterium]HNH30030.1 pirin family protein [bacterium]
MPTVFHKAESRGFADHGWLRSYHTFSFAGYHDPKRMNFGLLRVLNDDTVRPGSGFGEHPHDNMEIISIPLEGTLAHADSTGSEKAIRTGDVQIMSAGSGLTHSEYNHSASAPVNFLQLWIYPKRRNIEPRYDQKTFDLASRKNQWVTVVAPDENAESLWINQDAVLSLAVVERGEILYTPRFKENGIYIFMIDGNAQYESQLLGRRDAIGIHPAGDCNLIIRQPSHILLIEVPMNF